MPRQGSAVRWPGSDEALDRCLGIRFGWQGPMKSRFTRGRVFALFAVLVAVVLLFSLVAGIRQGRERVRIQKADSAAVSRCVPALAGSAFRAAITGPGEEHMRAAFCVVRALARVSLDGHTVGEHGRLQVKDRSRLDAMAAMRPVLAEFIAAHISTIGLIYAWGLPTSHPRAHSYELDAFLVWLSRDQASYERVLRAQIAHTRARIDADITDPGGLQTTVIEESATLGHVLEARAQSVIAQTGNPTPANQDFRDLVSEGIGLIPLPEHTPTTDNEYDQLGARLEQQTRTHPSGGRSRETYDVAVASGFISDTLIASSVAHGTLHPTNLSFAPGGKFRPLTSLTGKQWEDLTDWLTLNSHVSSLSSSAEIQLRYAAQQTTSIFFNDHQTRRASPSV
jgi:hypothetical protein